MSFLGKALIAATARKNTPPRFDDVETYRFGEYDVDLSDVLQSTVETNLGVYEKYSMVRNGSRPIGVNYSSDGLTYYITHQHTSVNGSTTLTWYTEFEVTHLTLSRSHDLRTITSSTTYVIDFSDTDSVAAEALSRNQACKISWHNNGYNFTYIGKDSGNATNTEYTAYAFSVTTPYTGIGATKIDEIHDPIFMEDSELIFDTIGKKAFVATPDERLLAIQNNLTAGYWKLGGGDRNSQFPLPSRCQYWNKIKHMGTTLDNVTPSRISIFKTGTTSTATAHVFYPYKTTTNNTYYNHFYLQRHTAAQRSTRVDFFSPNVTVTEYNIGQLIADLQSPAIIFRDPRDYGFSNDGLKIYVLGRLTYSPNDPWQIMGFDLSTAYDPSTMTGTYQTLDFGTTSGLNAGTDNEVCAFCFNNRPTYRENETSTRATGTVLYVLRLSEQSGGREVIQFDLSTAWDISTATLANIIPETSTGLTVANNVSFGTAAQHDQAQYTSIIMHHPRYNQGGVTGTGARAAESLIVYPMCTSTTDQQIPWVIYDDGFGLDWTYVKKTDLNEQILTSAGVQGNGTTMSWPLTETLHGFTETTNDTHQIGEAEYELGSPREQIRRETYYRRMFRAEMTYNASSTDIYISDYQTGQSNLQDSTYTRRGGATGSTVASWRDSYVVGSAKKFAGYTYGSGSQMYGMVWVLFEEVADNKDVANNGNMCLNRYRLGGVQQVDMDFGQLASYNSSQTMNALPITEIFSPVYTDGIDRISAMFPVPKVPASGDDPEIPQRMGFIDDRGYCYYLDTIGQFYDGTHYWPLPSVSNHPGGDTTGTAMGNGMNYTKTDNTVSCHVLYQDDLTTYDAYQKYQRILDFDFDPTGHVCCVLGMSETANGSDARTVFVYYVDRPFSTNKSDWTYVTSGSTTSNTSTYRIKIVDGHVFIHDFDNDAITVSVDVAAILTNGPTYSHPALSFTSASAASGGSDFLWVDYNIDRIDGTYTFYDSIRADISGSTIYLYHGQVNGAVISGETKFYTAWTTSGQVYWRTQDGTLTRLSSVDKSERGIWYDKTHETFYFVHELGEPNSDGSSRAPLRLLKSKVLDKDEDGTGNWLIEEPTLYELKTKLPFAVETFKIYGDRIVFVEWQGRFLGSTRMR